MQVSRDSGYPRDAHAIATRHPGCTLQSVRRNRLDLGAHLCCAAVTMGFFFMWPVLAVRDTFHLELLLTSRIIAYLYLGLWSVAGSLAVIADLRHGIRIDLLGATGGFVFCGLWLINFFAYPVPLDPLGLKAIGEASNVLVAVGSAY